MQAGSSSPPEERQPNGELKHQLPFEADEESPSPLAAQSEQPPPTGERIQPPQHPFEPGGLRGGNGGGRTSFSSSSADGQRERGRVAFDESCSHPQQQQQQRRQAGTSGSSPPSPLQQQHGQPLGSVPALHAPGGATALSGDAAAIMVVASGELGGAAHSGQGNSGSPRGSGPPPGHSPPFGASPAHSVDNTMGVSAAGGGGGGGNSQAMSHNAASSDGGSAMSLDALDPAALEGESRLEGHSPLSGAASADGSEHHHLARPGMAHSGSAKTLRGLDSAELGAQLGLVGVKRSGSGVLSPPPRAPERKVPTALYMFELLL